MGLELEGRSKGQDRLCSMPWKDHTLHVKKTKAAVCSCPSCDQKKQSTTTENLFVLCCGRKDLKSGRQDDIWYISEDSKNGSEAHLSVRTRRPGLVSGVTFCGVGGVGTGGTEGHFRGAGCCKCLRVVAGRGNPDSEH